MRLGLSIQLACTFVAVSSGAVLRAQDLQQDYPSGAQTSAGDTADVASTENPRDVEAARQALDRATQLLDDLENAESAITPAQMEEVSALLESARVANPTDPTLLFVTGRANALSGRTQDAIEAFQAYVATRDGRTDWRAFRRLGDLYVEQYPQLAKSNYRKALKLNPAEPDVLFGMARCALLLGRGKEALAHARQAVEADGRRTVRLLSLYVEILFRTRNWDDAERESAAAVQLAEHAVETNPGVRKHLAALGRQYQMAIQILRSRFAESPPTDAEALRLVEAMRNRIGVEGKIARFDVAEWLAQAVDARGDDASAELRLQYGIALVQTDRPEEARAILEKILEADADNAAAREWLDQVGTQP